MAKKVSLNLGQKQLLVAALAIGLVAGAGSSFGVLRYWPNLIPISKKQVLIQENSAVQDVIKRVAPSVVSITSRTNAVDILGLPQGQEEGIGTGIIVGSDGLILTNRHVV